MMIKVTVFFMDGTEPFTFGTTPELVKQTARKIFKEGFIANLDNSVTIYHSPHNIKKVETRPA